MRENWVIPGIICIALGVLAFFTASEIQVQVGLLPFSFALIIFFVSGVVLLIAGIVSFIINRRISGVERTNPTTQEEKGE